MQRVGFRKSFIFLLSIAFGLALSPLLLWGGALALGIAPLSEGELLNFFPLQQLDYANVRDLCQRKRRSPRAPNEIVVFGASAVSGAFASEGKDFPSQLERQLQSRYPGQWTVHNLGQSGKTSFWMHHCADALEAEPGMKYWIAYEGHNDFADLHGEGVGRTLFLLEHPALMRAASLFFRSAAGGWLRFFPRPPRISQDLAAFEKEISTILAASEKNYRALIHAAAERHVRLVLSTVISNLALAPNSPALPGKSDRNGASAAFAQAEEAFSRKNFEEALLLYHLARDRDPRLWRAPASFNEMIRRLSAEFPKEVQLLDLEKDFEHEFRHEKLGCRFFGSATHCDLVHPNDFTHAWIAARIERLLFPLGVAQR